MRQLAVVAPLWLAVGFLWARPPKPAPNALRHRGETILFCFKTARGKTALLCEGPDGAYLVYRFGTATHLQLQYPAVLNGRSWRKFAYETYRRPGGAHNAGRDTRRLFFSIGHTEYALLDETEDLYNERHWEIERRTVGLFVYGAHKTIFIAGQESSAIWELRFDEEQEKKVRPYDGESPTDTNKK
jgi:hypothetical protein